ncbi:hypothetical protein MHZ95_00350 [Sporosarcina sp. ACRSM]|uniref:ornithine cyclodeaminase family protein n=1 Tax=Sporosarcina sp. ACRSM TaxID=2918216 RepID=UPI001EF74D44|nr:ornithine cyclodeaminase family protein [Sporosarcina sp. ACRSM]MCG7333720.1 hypothetical protein [Sporosarcina sp. ACRSM]
MEETFLLSQESIKELITIKDVVEICEQTFIGFGEGTTINPAKVGLDLGEQSSFPSYQGFMNAMPAYVGWLDTAGIKWAGGLLGERQKRGLPFITSLIMLINPEIGNFTAVLDGAHITNLRTGSQTSITLKYLKKDSKSISLGLYGAGAQGRTQTMAIAENFKIKELFVYDIHPEAAEAFKEEMSEYVEGDIHAVSDPKEVAQANVIVAVTQAKEPFIKKEWIQPGTIIFPLGSYQEVEDDLILGADNIIVDHVEQCLHRGALKKLSDTNQFTADDIKGTVGDLVVGKISEIKNDDITIALLIGTGALDIAVAQVVYERAVKKGIGSSFSFV